MAFLNNSPLVKLTIAGCAIKKLEDLNLSKLSILNIKRCFLLEEIKDCSFPSLNLIMSSVTRALHSNGVMFKYVEPFTKKNVTRSADKKCVKDFLEITIKNKNILFFETVLGVNITNYNDPYVTFRKCNKPIPKEKPLITQVAEFFGF